MNAVSKAARIKVILQEELIKEPPNLSTIAELTEQLLALDETTARFSVDANHIQRLGLELVGKQETALSELIKNAFDADATYVRITFSDYQREGGAVLVEDDGLGMTDQVVRNAWMRLSTDEKARNPLSDRYGRLRAGKKGIGRFAAQRLGRELVLETRVRGESQGIRVTFDWDGQFVSGRSLLTIANPVEHFSKDMDDQGTRLIIKNLRDRWPEGTIERVWKSVLLLQPPFKLAKKGVYSQKDHSMNERDPGFSVYINGLSGEERRTEVSIETNFLAHAIATITGSVNQDGKAVFHVQSLKLGLDETFTPDEEFLLVGPTVLEARYFIYESDALSGLSVATASQMGRQYGGIRIYRNGFRVLPYGEARDDWLKLAFDMARRAVLIPINNYHFFGHVEISAENNILLEETSSREGLIENEAYSELQKFARSCVEWAALRVGAYRERKLTAGQKSFTSKEPRKPSEIFKSLLKDAGQTQTGSSREKEFEDAEREVLSYERKVEKEREALLRYEAMLRILASLGISISIFGHEIKGGNAAIVGKMNLLKESLNKELSGPAQGIVSGRLDKLADAVGKVTSLGNYVADLMSSTGSREMKSVSVHGAIERFIEQFSDYMHKQSIEFDASAIPKGLRTTEMHPSELDSVLFNFLTNSLKAMKRAKTAKRKIRISASREEANALISFEDNGTGVPKDIEHRIFDAFYTTTFQDPDEIAGPGTGLGLRIVSDIATSYGGSVSLGTPTEGYNCRFDFRIPITGGDI